MFINSIAVLFSFFAVMICLSYFIKTKKGSEQFLCADRNLSLIPSSFSIAATWIWAPALFLASQKAYEQGWVGVFWFIVPNILCLIIFSEFAHRLRDRMPFGFTLSEYMKKVHGTRVQVIYLVELIGLSVCSFAIQLLAGGLVFSTITGLSFSAVTIIMSVIALSYSLISGIRASVKTDQLQYIIILLVSMVLVGWTVMNVGPAAIVAGLGGVSGQFTSLISGPGGAAFFSFGIPVTIGLLAGPFGDQSFWQRAMSIERTQVRKSFIIGAFAFGIIPILLSVLGFIAAGTGMEIANTQLTNFEVILAYLPAWTTIPFLFMLLSGLVSTLDSCLCAVSSLAATDIYEKVGKVDDMFLARAAMIILAVVGIAIANIPGMQILYLFLFYGTLRASVLIPTVFTILNPSRHYEKAIFWGIVCAITIGLPIFAYGNFLKITVFIVVGALTTVLIPGIAILLKRLKQ